MSIEMLKIGDKAPDFCLPNHHEEKICLKDFKGSWVVLYFYPKDNTPGCTIEAVNFTEKKSDYDDLGAVILGVSKDSCGSHIKFIEKKGLKITLLSDEEHSTIEAYGVWRPKKFMGREFMGIVRSTFLIDQAGVIAFIWPEVKVSKHVDEVMEKIRELNK